MTANDPSLKMFIEPVSEIIYTASASSLCTLDTSSSKRRDRSASAASSIIVYLTSWYHVRKRSAAAACSNSRSISRRQSSTVIDTRQSHTDATAVPGNGPYVDPKSLCDSPGRPETRNAARLLPRRKVPLVLPRRGRL